MAVSYSPPPDLRLLHSDGHRLGGVLPLGAECPAVFWRRIIIRLANQLRRSSSRALRPIPRVHGEGQISSDTLAILFEFRLYDSDLGTAEPIQCSLTNHNIISGWCFLHCRSLFFRPRLLLFDYRVARALGADATCWPARGLSPNFRRLGWCPNPRQNSAHGLMHSSGCQLRLRFLPGTWPVLCYGTRQPQVPRGQRDQPTP